MKAIILAAGRGSRMGELTERKPKCLTMLAGKSLLEWQIKALTSGGVTEIGIVTGYLADQIKVPGARYFYNGRWDHTNMVSSLQTADIWLQESPAIVTYSDIFYGAEPVNRLINATSDISLTYDPNWLSLWKKRFNDPLTDAETFQINKEGFLVEIGQKPNSLSEVEGQFMGLLHFKPNGWRQVQKVLQNLRSTEIECLDSTALLRHLIHSKRSIAAIPSLESWGEVDSEADLLAYQNLFREGAFPWMN